MTCSRHNTSGVSRPSAINQARNRHSSIVPLASAIAAILAGAPAYAQQSPDSAVLEEVVVTAQKKSENLQDVPIAIIALGTQKLEELHVQNLDDYVKYLPSVSYSRGQGQGGNGQPGSSHVYMRGVVSGANENHSGSQPSVGTYLDEQPVTTIDGTVDVHVYDIARVEVLEGPQGTLYGASSQAGTIRIITNKPDPTKFSAGYDFGANQISHGSAGYTLEGFVNLPISENAAIRLVGWVEHDGGFIDNVAGTNAPAGIVNGVRTFNTWSGQLASADGSGVHKPKPQPPYVIPTNGVIGAGAISNAAYRKNNYNTADTKGARAALKLNISDSWTITPTVMGQSVNSEGFFGYDPAVGDLQVVHFGPENSQDSWTQTALTVEGKVANLDMVYAGAYMKRTIHSIADYSDYSFFYDNLDGSGQYWTGNNGKPIMGQQIVVTKGYFQKWSHELRFSTPQQYPVKATFGGFIQRQLHDIYENYVMPGYGFVNPGGGGNPAGLSDYYSIPSTPGNSIWLTDEQRIDRDQAAFAQLTWDMTSQLSGSVGYRFFKSDNTLVGFFGYNQHYSSHTGMVNCPKPYVIRVNGTPCTDLDRRVSDSGNVPRYNLTYKITPDAMVYATYSKGFRPGGVNRTAVAGIGPYAPDFLTNYEIGWKTQWFDRRLRWNGSLFQEDWKNFQFSFLGLNSVTIIENGGNARIKGIESELEWAVTSGLTLSTSFTLIDPRLQQNYCSQSNPVTHQVPTSDPCPVFQTQVAPGGPPIGTIIGTMPIAAPAGANLPIAPKFKGNIVSRYNWQAGNWDADVQGAFVYQTKTAPALKTADQQSIGMQPAYGLFDMSGGIGKNGMNIQFVVNNVTDKRAQISRFEQCTVGVCQQPYIIPAQPRTFGIKFGQKF